MRRGLGQQQGAARQKEIDAFRVVARCELQPFALKKIEDGAMRCR